MERLAPRWCLDEVGPVLSLPAVFGRVAPVIVEIGSGDGEATLATALDRPEHDVIAIDVHTPGVAALLAGAEAAGAENVRAVHGDALVFLARIQAASLHEVRVLFPDPWPKRKQHARRLIQPGVVAAIVDRLVPGGALHLATDVAAYATHMNAVCAAEPRLAGGEVERPAWRHTTRFERAAAVKGRQAHDLRFVRVWTGPVLSSLVSATVKRDRWGN